MAYGAIITAAGLAGAVLAGCGSPGSGGADAAALNGVYGTGGPFATLGGQPPDAQLAGGGLAGGGQTRHGGGASRRVARVAGSTAMEGSGYRVPWLPPLGAGVAVTAPRSVRPGTGSPASAAAGFYQAFYGKQPASACAWVVPSQRAGCPARLGAASGRAGTLRDPAVGFVVTRGPAAIVTMTGVTCGANGTRAAHCIAQRDPAWVFGQHYPFADLWSRLAAAGGNPLTATPFQRVAGHWYLNLRPAAAG
jgi:hypothetical protein